MATQWFGALALSLAKGMLLSSQQPGPRLAWRREAVSLAGWLVRPEVTLIWAAPRMDVGFRFAEKAVHLLLWRF